MNEKKIFFGWYVTVFAAISLIFGSGVRGAFGIFFPSMLQELGWSRTLLSGVLSLSLVVNAFLSPVVGNLVGRFGGRWLISTGGILLGTGTILAGRSSEVWHLFAAYGVILAVGINCMGTVVNQSMVVGWFNKKRAFALAITSAGITLGTAVLNPLSNFLINRFGWRLSNMFLGISVIVIVVPLAQFFAKRRPEDMGLLPDGDDPGAAAISRQVSQKTGPVAIDEPEITYAEGLKSVNFWLLMVAYLLMAIPGFVIMTHLFAFAVERGVSEFHAANVTSVAAILGLLNGFLFGFVSDKYHSRKIPLIFGFSIVTLSYVLLIYLKSTFMFYLYAVLSGIGGGAYVVIPALIGDQFGRMGMGKFFGIITLSGAFGAAVGPVLGGYIYDTTQSYVWAWITCIFFNIAAVLCVAFLGKSPVERKVEALKGDIREN